MLHSELVYKEKGFGAKYDTLAVNVEVVCRKCASK